MQNSLNCNCNAPSLWFFAFVFCRLSFIHILYKTNFLSGVSDMVSIFRHIRLWVHLLWKTRSECQNTIHWMHILGDALCIQAFISQKMHLKYVFCCASQQDRVGWWWLIKLSSWLMEHLILRYSGVAYPSLGMHSTFCYDATILFDTELPNAHRTMFVQLNLAV